MFKIELPDTFDSFADFSGYLDPAVKNIEQYISQKVRVEYYRIRFN